MELHPFTLAQAEEVWDDFGDLKDTEFTLSTATFIIDDILVCPYDDVEKAVFFDSYLINKNAATALGTYTGDEFDVIIVICDAADESVISYMGIRQFAAEKGINTYNFPSGN